MFASTEAESDTGRVRIGIFKGTTPVTWTQGTNPRRWPQVSAERSSRNHLLFDSISQAAPVVLLKSMPTVVHLRSETTRIVSE